jgi:serine/threonine protein kinase
MYRDLKPENCLMGPDGYIKLSDFGLAKRASTSNTFCGTPEYISPEMILGQGHRRLVGTWSLDLRNADWCASLLRQESQHDVFEHKVG